MFSKFDNEQDKSGPSEQEKESSILLRIAALEEETTSLDGNISGIRREMNKRFMRCVTLQQHATRLSNVGFSIPALLDVSSISGMDVMSAHSSSECIPLLFSTGVA
ncbi:hypothetical protein ADUPG1_004034, partial [Aduncisulcus paluster]